MGKEVKINIPLGGQFSSGAAADIPDGMCREVRNYLFRPRRLEPRPPFVYDNLMSIRSLANFQDDTNKVSRMVALNATPNLFMKGTSGETWSASLGSASGTRLTASANYRGKLYGMMDNGAGLPTAAFSFDGTNIDTTPFNSSIQGRTVTVFNDRLIIAYPRVTVSPLFNSADAGPTSMYNLTNATRWQLSGITAQNVESNGTTICRLYPTSTTAASFYYSRSGVGGAGGGFPVAASATATPVVWRADFRCLHATFRMPVTLEIVLLTAWADATVYAAGDVVQDDAGSIHRCITGGTSGGSAPTWATTVGATTTDNTVTWIHEGSDILGSVETHIPNATDAPGFTTIYVDGRVPPSTNSLTFTVRCKFYNTSTPTITLAPVDVALRDGLADGDARKRNYGQQVTLSDYRFPFFNTETATSATFDLSSVVWSEIAQPERILGTNTYQLSESPGYPTASIASAGRVVVFQRSAFTVFLGSPDPDNPLSFERDFHQVGCLGPKAVDVLDDTIFFASENTIHSMTAGTNPQDIAGDAMREEIMDRGANWVESQATYNMPIVRVHPKDRQVWVYTQKGKLFVYDLERKWWSTADIDGDVSGKEIADLLYNSNTGRMYAAIGGFGLARIDDTSAAEDSIDNTATTYDVPLEIVTKPIEVSGPRYDSTIDIVGIHHMATESQSGETTEVAISFDGGVTYPRSNIVRFAAVSSGGKDRIPVPVWQEAPTLTIKVKHLAKAGSGVFPLSHLDAELIVEGEEYPRSIPTQVSNTLTS